MSSLASASSSGGSGLSSLLIFAIPVLLIAFMFWSQRRRQRNVQHQQAALEVGDQGRTTSGLYGRIVSLDDSYATLEVSRGVQLRFDRRAVLAAPAAAAAPQSATEPTPESATADEPDNDPSTSPRTSGE